MCRCCDEKCSSENPIELCCEYFSQITEINETAYFVIFQVADARKESVTSDIGFLAISGRTSRLSSVGSATSQGSGASNISGLTGSSYGSHISSTSRLSAHSNLSKTSRCSSPYKMLLETSFCGPKPASTVKGDLDPPNSEILDLIKNTENLISKEKVKCLETTNKEHFSDVVLKTVKQHELQKEKKSELKVGKTTESRVLEDPTKIFISLHEELPQSLLDTLKTPTQPKPSSSNRDRLSAHSNGDRKHRSKSKKSKSKDKEHRSKSRSRGHAEPIKAPPPVVASSTKVHSGEDQIFISLHEDPKEPTGKDGCSEDPDDAITKMKPFTNPTLKKFISRNVDEISVAPSTQKTKPEVLDPSLHQIISLHEDPPPKPSQNKDGKTVVKVVPDSSPAPTSMITDSDNQIFISLHEDNIKPMTPKPDTKLHQPKQSVHSIATQLTRDKTKTTGSVGTTKDYTNRESHAAKTTNDSSCNTLPKSKSKMSDRATIGGNHLHIFIPLKGDEEIRPIELEAAGPVNPGITLYPNDDPLVKIIPLHGDDDEIQKDWSRSQTNIDNNEANNNLLSCNESTERTNRSMPNMTTCPELTEYKVKPKTLDLMNVERPERPVKSLTHLAREESRTPSPGRSNLTRRSSESYKDSRPRTSGNV